MCTCVCVYVCTCVTRAYTDACTVCAPDTCVRTCASNLLQHEHTHIRSTPAPVVSHTVWKMFTTCPYMYCTYCNPANAYILD